MVLSLYGIYQVASLYKRLKFYKVIRMPQVNHQ